MNYELVTGDTGSLLRVPCIYSETQEAINLTGATVMLRWQGTGALVERAMTITDAAAGIVQYHFLAGEIIAPKMKFEVEITDSEGFVVSNLELIEIAVRKQLG